MWLVVMTDILVCAHKYILHPHHHDLSFPMHVCHVKRKKKLFPLFCGRRLLCGISDAQVCGLTPKEHIFRI